MTSGTAFAGEPGSLPESIGPYFQQYCFQCHGEQRQSAGLRLDQLPGNFAKRSDIEKWQEVLDRLNAADMPPAEAKQPRPQESAPVIEWLTEQLQHAAAKGPSEIVLRRLNRNEYNATIRDLIGIDFRPADDFPADPPAHGFDNIGAALQLSPPLLAKYLKAARRIVDRAIVTTPRPPHHVWHIELDQAYGKGVDWHQDPFSKRHRYIWMGYGSRVENGFLVHRGGRENACGFRWFKIPAEGEYLIRVRAAGVVPDRETVIASARKTRLKRLEEDKEFQQLSSAEQAKQRQQFLTDEWPELEEHFRTDPMYEYGAPRMKVTNQTGEVLGTVSVEASPDAPQVYTFRGEFTPRPGETDSVRIVNDYSIPRVLENFWFQHDDTFARPELWIDWIAFEGVHYDQWPPTSQSRILFESPNRDRESIYAREVLERFMPRAWRRPVTSAEVDRMLALYEQARPSRDSFAEAIKLPLIAVLTSPHFLYLVETRTADQPTQVSDFELASRLSYFLWSSMPDPRLFELAQASRLHDPKVLRDQVDRMLADPRSKAFVDNFTTQWLGLRSLGANPPVANLYPRYDPHLAESMAREGPAFLAELLHNDLSVMNLVRSDFVVVNQRLARFYGMAGVKGDHYRRVPIPRGVRRGGVLTQAGVLTVTSNGTRTSPVIRGKWVLDNILGTPPPPPPPDAGDLAPKVPGIDKATVRDRLLAHRQIAQCASCHNKIDPLGFALENFDAHGRWRDQYGFGYNGRVGHNDPKVDVSAILPDGRSFTGVDGLQRILLAEEDRFLNCLIDKLLIYALGRGLDGGDRFERDRLRERFKQHGYSLRALIKELVTSRPFQTK